ncbi:MAG: hypothetical protein EOR10_16405 [Mesorhizobium sp.]|nr:MAG: hypothetical protein EOR10_16405 [Mesorhizobium sp.]
MESPLCRCDRRAATVHAALFPTPARRSQRLPSTAAAHAARCAKPMRRTGASIGRGVEPQQGGRPALPAAWPRRACGDVRGVCPILVLVNRLQKEHPT